MNVSRSERDFIQSVANVLVGKKSWGVSLGFGTFLTLEFGKPQRQNEADKRGEFHLWIYGCAWRIEKGNQFLMGSQDNVDRIAESVSEILNDLTVEEVQINLSTFDTVFRFESNISLQTFSNSSDMEHWILYLPNEKMLSIGPEFTYQAVKLIEH